uniref:DNA-binding protein D-ETS-4 n=1 Tax=Acrobeloides nanus TaxID=290746 RepID=A0A914BZV8_9BILA
MNSLLHENAASICWTESLSTPSSSDAEDDDTDSVDYCENDVKLEDPFSMLQHELDSPPSEHMQNLKLHSRTTSLTQQKAMPIVSRLHASSDGMLSHKNGNVNEQNCYPEMISPHMIKTEYNSTVDECIAPKSAPQPPQSSQSNNEAAQMDIYRDLILRHLIQDITTTCAKLYLPTDPNVWTAEHSNRWINEMCQQFQLPSPKQVSLPGRTLLGMSQEEFCMILPDGGDTIFAQLQLWKTAFESYHQQQHQPGSANSSYHQQQHQPGSANSVESNMTASTRGNAHHQWNNHATMQNSACGANNTRSPEIHNFQNCNSNTSQSLNAYYVPQNSNTYQNMQQNSLNSNFFMNNPNILPSPSDSDISSNASSCVHDSTDEECSDISSFLSIPQMPYGQPASNGLALPTLQNNNNSHLGFVSNGANPAFNNMLHMDGMGNPIRGPAHPNVTSAPFGRNSGTVHLWHFIRELLDQPKQYGSCVRWVDRDEGTFKIESSHHLARFWGLRKNRAQMNYDKLSRSLRQYYKKGIIQKPEKKQRLVYKFLPPYNL